MNIISVNGLVRSFTQGKNELKILKGINLEINAGEQIAIIGASGSGKSTLLHFVRWIRSANRRTCQCCRG